MISIDLEGKVACVTGGAGGMGEATCLKLAEAGALVVVSDINYEGAEKVAQKIINMGNNSIAVETDVSEKEDVDKMVEITISKFGKIDIMVNNAGVSKAIKFINVDLKEFNRVYDINVKGVYLCCKAVLPYMIKQKSGKIINFSSMAGKEAGEFFVHYSSTKFAVMGLTQGIAKEVAQYNINVNAVCPGIVRTELWKELLEQLKIKKEFKGLDNEEIWEKYINSIPLKRAQDPEDIASMVAYLSSDLAKNITGQGINITGGMSLH